MKPAMKAAALVAALCWLAMVSLCAAGDASAADDVTLVVHDQDRASKVITPVQVNNGAHGGAAAAADAVAQAHHQQQQQQQQQSVKTIISSQDMVDEADKVRNPITFRSQAELTVNDGSTEADIPGLAPTDIAAVKRAIPDLEHFSPILTTLTPFLPDLHDITNALGIYLPVSWQLSNTGPINDWLKAYLGAYWTAFWGKGPRPRQAPTILVPNKDAYKKLAQDIAKHSGMPRLPKLLKNPITSSMAAVAVYDQLASNMLLPNAALMGSATNGTVYMTSHDVKLTLLVKHDGSRYLVSNTTIAKIVKADIWTGPPYPITFAVVDNFIVPKLTLLPRPLPPLITEKDRRNMPMYTEMWQDAFKSMPGALAGMPGAIKDMLQAQQRFRPRAPAPASGDTLTVTFRGKDRS
ncbi:hypothetical protein COO60DRAFT_1697872 [Scenedesmus sp. NREL 46B-D3]|nr:hypothetical protein COO60DRAFT_1697872 [Scenedesmus sp. NREL 46B-D3]